MSAVARYHLQLWLGGLATTLLAPLSLAAGGLDLLAGRGPQDGAFAQVRALGAAFSRAFDPHNATPTGALLDPTPEAASGQPSAVGRAPA